MKRYSRFAGLVSTFFIVGAINVLAYFIGANVSYAENCILYFLVLNSGE